MQKSLSQLLGHSALLLDRCIIESMEVTGEPEIAEAAQLFLELRRRDDERLQAMMNDPEWQERAAENRATIGAAAIHCKTCDRCSRQCDNLEVDDNSFYDWCATCKRHLCGTCFDEGCCGSTPAESGLKAM